MSTHYKQVGKIDPDLTVCCKCKCALPTGDSPWSICYDPQYKDNCWGGDTHIYKGMMCQSCAEELLKCP